MPYEQSRIWRGNPEANEKTRTERADEVLRDGPRKRAIVKDRSTSQTSHRRGKEGYPVYDQENGSRRGISTDRGDRHLAALLSVKNRSTGVDQVVQTGGDADVTRENVINPVAVANSQNRSTGKRDQGA